MGMFLGEYWWLWMLVGFVVFLSGAIWNFKSSSLYRGFPMAAVGAVIFTVGVFSGMIYVVAPWVVKHFGH